MQSRHRLRTFCGCSRTLRSLSSTLLFLSLILPTASFAQITSTLATSSRASTATLTSTTSSPPSISTNPSPLPTNDNPASSSPTNAKADPTSINDNAFHYYFLIIAVVAILFCLCVLYIGRRKKRKAEIMRSNSQRALARDVEGFRSRLRGRAGLGFPSGPVRTNRSDIEEGLDERGEAPPPYMPGTKPPSLRSVDGARRPSTSDEHRVGEDVELRPIGGAVEHPPGYHEHVASESDGVVTRPDTAVTASERFGSVRRLISRSGRSSDQDGNVVR